MGRFVFVIFFTYFVLDSFSVPPALANDAADNTTPSMTGSTGLYRLSTASISGSRTLQLAVFGDISRSSNLLVLGDVDTQSAIRVVGALSLSRHVEVFGAFVGSYNHDRQSFPNNQTVVEEAFDGNLLVGAKTVVSLGRAGAGGGEVGARVPLNEHDLAAAISVWGDALCSFDLLSLAAVPLQFHISLGFYVDKSTKLYSMADLSASQREIVMFEHGMGYSRIRTAAGLEGHRRGAVFLGIVPFAEYHLEIVTASPNNGLEDQMPVNADQQWLTVGVKLLVSPKVTVSAGADVSIRSVGFAHGPPLPLYELLLGASIPFSVDRAAHPHD